MLLSLWTKVSSCLISNRCNSRIRIMFTLGTLGNPNLHTDVPTVHLQWCTLPETNITSPLKMDGNGLEFYFPFGELAFASGAKWLLVSTWWFHFCFYVHPYLGKISNLSNILQMGWFNHQLDKDWFKGNRV